MSIIIFRFDPKWKDQSIKTLISRATSPATPATKKKIDKSRLNELDSSTLVELIKDYMGENQSLRRENGDLFSVRDMMLRFHTLTV